MKLQPGTAVLACALVVLAPPATAAGPPQAPAAPGFQDAALGFLEKHCLSCHSAARKKGDVSLEALRSEAGAARERDLWKSVAEKVRKGEMPPEGKPRPSKAEADALLRWIERAVFGAAGGGKADPGRVTIRRLNRYEYNYTTRDLLGVDLKLGDTFPPEDLGYGFDNIGDVLSISPLLMERYLGAAEKLASRAILADPPADRSKLPASHRAIIFEEPRSKAQWTSTGRKILERFATRAYRRPAKAEDVSRLLKILEVARKNGDTFEGGIQAAVTAVLASPQFLFRVELDPDPRSAEAHPLDDWQLATRLSYFLWSSLPDAELSDLAAAGKLREGDTLERQARRMIRDSKSRGFLKTFSALWLGSRAMKDVSPDPERFPKFDEELRQAMRSETEQFFNEVMQKDLSILTFLDADFTFLNERLAKHYGIPGVKGDEVRRVALDPESGRGGVVTQGTVLSVTSNPTRTSPVKRGRWILEQLLGQPPPPPMPGADNLKEEGEGAVTGTLRQKMEQHRSDPECASCHAKMDPLGFALETFDAVGKRREKDGDLPIDDEAELPGGRRFRGARELKRVLLEKKDDFALCFTEKMLTFALGRGLEPTDRAAVEAIARTLEEDDYRFSALVLAIVRSEPFQMRRGEPVTP